RSCSNIANGQCKGPRRKQVLIAKAKTWYGDGRGKVSYRRRNIGKAGGIQRDNRRRYNRQHAGGKSDFVIGDPVVWIEDRRHNRVIPGRAADRRRGRVCRCDVISVDSADEGPGRSEEHTSELQSRENLVCRLLLEKKKII